MDWIPCQKKYTNYYPPYNPIMQIKPSKTTIALLTAGCFLSFFVFGFTDNLKGPTLPSMLAELHITYGTGGNIFFGEYLGFLIAALTFGIGRLIGVSLA
jgi:fucose permease